VQCPLCKHIFFPLRRGKNTDGTILEGRETAPGQTKFFYGGDYIDGDLKLEMKIVIEAAGSLRLETGNTLRRAVWNIPGGAEADEDKGMDGGGKSHFVQKPTAPLTPGEHTLTLAYVDGTVIATLDGAEVERRPIDVKPMSARINRDAMSVARVSLNGVKGRIVAMNLYRDLFHTTWPQSEIWPREHEFRYYDEDQNFIFNIPEGEYLMLGDNSPSSSDGRVWGFVPRERLMGRAWIVGWPPSRAKAIR
jgi:hypothetical protein